MSVLHVDENEYYGDTEASLSLDELEAWSNLNHESHQTSIQGSKPLNSRAFSLSLSPSILPATGPLITNLIQSGVSRYTSFKLLDEISIFEPTSEPNSDVSQPSTSQFKPVPTSKAAIFSSSLSFPQKRKLMRFIQLLGLLESATDICDRKELQGKEDMPFLSFLTQPPAEGGAFGIQDGVAAAIAYSLGFCESNKGQSSFIRGSR